MIMVSVNVGNDKDGKPLDPIVGLLLDTHLVPMAGPSKATIGEGGKLIQSQGQMGLQGFGVVATDKGFIVGPLASMTPMLQPDEIPGEGEGEDDSGGRMSIGAKEESDEVEDGERKEELSA